MGWHEVQAEALRRIQTREWPPGALIPPEADLARELGCARATVNRALQALADDGWIERRRRAGSRVAPAPERRAQVSIPLIRKDIAARGMTPGHRILSHGPAAMPATQRLVLDLGRNAKTWRTRTLYLADDRPFAVEDRWVNVGAAPGYADADLAHVSPNEWLVMHAPFAHGTLDYSADAATPEEAATLGLPESSPVLVMERTTFAPGDAAVTRVRLVYPPTHRLRLSI